MPIRPSCGAGKNSSASSRICGFSNLYTSFVALGELGALDMEFARNLAPSAGLRNRLVHAYDRIDDRIVLESVRSALAQYPRFVAEIEAFLAKGP